MLVGCNGGNGTPLSPSPFTAERTHARRAYTLLHSFEGYPDGLEPYADLISVKGLLYGTTESGGSSPLRQARRLGGGTVFSITPSGTETVLHNFAALRRDGANPDSGLINVNGTLYGTTSGGGSKKAGTVFSITTSGTEAVLHRFGRSGDGADPWGLINVKGVLYGTTEFGGGANSGGTVFSITTSGTETVLYSFKGGPLISRPRAVQSAARTRHRYVY
jgi:uncharacterized repeat protein (TIGR03803 family)